MDAELIHYKLVRPGLLSRVIYLDEISSTNEYASSLAVKQDTLILTGNQTGGKGRFGRKWVSTPGKNIALTLVKNLRLRIDEIHNAGFYSSLSLINALRKFTPEHSHNYSLKWPNDIMMNGKKIAGLLLETKDLKIADKKLFIGLGVNVNEENLEPDLISKATSLYLETGSAHSVEELIILFVEEFYSRIDIIFKTAELMEEWKKNCGHIGKVIGFRQLSDGEIRTATVKDIRNDGSLNLILENGAEKLFYSGEISLSPSYDHPAGF